MFKYAKKFVVLIASMMTVSGFAKTYVFDTLGGASLQPIVQQQLNQLPNGGSVMVYQGRLIINTTPENYREISQFIRQIDQLPATLTVSVRVGEQSFSQQNGGYGQIGVVQNRVFFHGQWQNHQQQTSGQQFFQVKTLSGNSASIGISQLLPTNQTYVGYGNRFQRPQIWIGQTLLTAEQGISVLPTQLSNGQVSLDISQANGKFGKFNQQTLVNQQSLANSVIMNKNQWVTIGYIGTQSQQNGTFGNESNQQQLPIQVMVN